MKVINKNKSANQMSPTKARKLSKSIARFNAKPDIEKVNETPNGITPLTISSGSKPSSKVTSCLNNKGIARPNEVKTNMSSASSDLKYVQRDDNVLARITRGRSQSKGRTNSKSLIIKNRNKHRRLSKSPTHVRTSPRKRQSPATKEKENLELEAEAALLFKQFKDKEDRESNNMSKKTNASIHTKGNSSKKNKIEDSSIQKHF